MKAILAPSGDQEGHLSWAPELFVRLRTGPFSMGTVKMSPRAENKARSPLGLSWNSSMRLPALTRLGRRAKASVGTVMETGVVLRDLMSKICNSPHDLAAAARLSDLLHE